MKKLIILSLISVMLFRTASADIKTNPVDELGNLYAYLMQNIKYPDAARLKNQQGNSIITFTLVKGSLKHLNIQTELGNGCDVEVLNSLMGYTHLNTLKDGLYALKTSFRLQGSNTAIINEDAKMPVGFTSLNTITIMAQASLNVIIRGTKAYGKDPLYIVDGKIPENGSINELDPNKIESITVLKNASAIALYGPEAENGVILITTKKAAIQKTNK